MTASSRGTRAAALLISEYFYLLIYSMQLVWGNANANGVQEHHHGIHEFARNAPTTSPGPQQGGDTQ